MKLNFLPAILMLFVLTMESSCKKEKNENPPLSGTSWVSHASANGIAVVETISFINATDFKDVAVVTGSINTTVTGMGTYTYDPPSVTFFTSSGTIIKGTINDNNLYAPSYDGTATLTYVKQ